MRSHIGIIFLLAERAQPQSGHQNRDLRYIFIYKYVKFDHKCACAKKVIAMAMTFDGQRSCCRSDVEKTGQCAKEEVF